MSTEGSTGYSLGGPTAQGPAGYPIGYWLKRLDRAIEGALDPTLAAENLTRRHWQTLNFGLRQSFEPRIALGRPVSWTLASPSTGRGRASRGAGPAPRADSHVVVPAVVRPAAGAVQLPRHLPTGAPTCSRVLG